MSDHQESQNPYAAPVDVAVSPGVAWAQTMSPSLRQTGVGLALVYYGIILILLSIIVLVGLPLVARGRIQPNVQILIVNSVAIGAFIGAVLNFIGPIVCLAAPSKSGAKGLIVGSVVFQLIAVASKILQYFNPVLFLQTPLLGLGTNIVSFIGAVLFILFMKKLAHFINRHDLADRAVRVLVGGALAFLLFVGWFAAILMRVLRDLGMISISVLVVGIVGLIVFVMYANLVGAMRTALLKGR